MSAAVAPAVCGFSCSVLLVLAHAASARATGSALQSSLENSFVFLWPSAVLLLGAQSHTGQAILFFFSACLNAGYYTFAALLFYIAAGHLRLSRMAKAKK